MDAEFGHEPPSTFRKAASLALGVAVFLYIVACSVGGSYGAAFFSIPIFVGYAAGVLYPFHPYQAAVCALLAAAICLVLTGFEGLICVLFALPFATPMLVMGAFAGATTTRYVKTRRGRNSSIVFVVLTGVVYLVWEGVTDDPAHHPVHVAEAEVRIAASPEAVFAALTARELRVENRWPWFLRIGLPIPERTRVETPAPGGRVRFGFSQCTAFGRIRTFRPPYELSYDIDRYEIHDLPFHITRLGRSPDYGFRPERVQDWLTLLDTRYVLTPVPDGTLLRQRVVWRRHLAPDLYFGWLQQTVISRSQVRLLELLRARIEGPAASQQESLTLL